MTTRKSARIRAIVLALACGTILSAAGPSAFAQQQNTLNKPKLPKIDKNQPLLLQADEVVYDNDNNIVTARGNVEIYYGDYTLLADRVIYDRGKSTLTAEGSVRIKEPEGSVVTAERIVLSDDFRDGFVNSLQVTSQDDLRISARASRKEGDTTIFEDAWYTPCKPCYEHPEAPPTWRIRAKKVIHRKDEKTLEYVQPTFELFGTPILYAPWFKHADPSIKRKSGFLVPSATHSSELGFTYSQPYYFALDPSYDFTFTPMVTQKEGTVLQGLWRQRTRYGGYKIDLAGVIQPDGEIFSSGGGFDSFDGARGSIKTSGLFALNEYWNAGWDVTLESDDTFRRFYKFDNATKTDRISQAFLIGLGDRSYFGARVYEFGGLLADDVPRSESLVHPLIDYNYIFANPILGGELSYNANLVSLSRDDGPDNNHIINELKWRRQLIDGVGQVYTPFAQLRGDLYQVSGPDDPVTFEKGDSGPLVRGMAVGGVEYRFPFVARTANAAHVLEPIGQLIGRPDTRDQIDVPNEDSRSLVFDDTLLFEIDKFSGYDRLEAGTRANVGLRYTVQFNSGSYARAVFGQSYQLAGDNDFQDDTGLENTRSDYVSGLYFEAVQNLGFFAQARFDEDDFTLRRTDLGSWGKIGPIQAAINFADIDPQPGLGFPDSRQEIQGDAAYEFVNNWSVIGHSRYNLADGDSIEDGVGLQFADDCFTFALTYEQTYIRDRDVEPDQKVGLRFTLKTLGDYSVATNPFDLFSASSEAGN